MAHFVKNISSSHQSFRAGGKPFGLAPGQSIPMTDEQFADYSTTLLISVGRLEELGKANAVSEMKKAAKAKKQKADERKLEVRPSDASVTQTVMMAQCAGVKKNGERCGNNVSVPFDEYDEHAEYFCKMHKSQERVHPDPDTEPLPLDF